MSTYRLPPYVLKEIDIKTLSQSPDWSIGEYLIPEQWKDADGSGVKVAVLDTGVQRDHPDLVDKIAETKDFTDSRYGIEDRFDHGTWCAGMIAAENNEIGTVGVAPGAELYIAKIIGDSGGGEGSNFIKAIDWATEQECQILSVSLGSFLDDQQVHDAIRRFCFRTDCFVISAAGNEGGMSDNSINYPAKWEESIAVGAVDRYGQRTHYSSKGPELDVMAPGDEMLSTITGNTYGLMSGTSMATPFVAGVIALALSKGISFGHWEDLREVIRDVSTDIDSPGRDSNTGWGLLNPTGILESGNRPDLPDVPDAPALPIEGQYTFNIGDAVVSFPVVHQKRRGIHIGIKE